MSLELTREFLEKQLIIPGSRLTRQWLDDECLALWLLQVDQADQKLSPAEITTLWNRLPFWSFAWAGGRALANFIVNNHDLVEGKTVLDFGCGSGIAGIAAALRGAKKVYVADIDAHALMAVEINSALNGVHLDVIDINDLPDGIDLLIASDVLYDISSDTDLTQLMNRIPNWLVAENEKVAPKHIDIRCLDQVTTNTLPRIGDFDESVIIDIYAKMSESSVRVLN